MWYKVVRKLGHFYLLQLSGSKILSSFWVGSAKENHEDEININRLGRILAKENIDYVTFGTSAHLPSEVFDAIVGELPPVSKPRDPKHSESNPAEQVKKDPAPDTVHDSPNSSDRGVAISHIIVHGTAGSYAGSVSWLCNPQSKVSAHLVIGKQGQVAQIVPFAKRAWHAGSSRINACSIGIEFEATDKSPKLTEVQSDKGKDWVRFLMKKYSVKKENVLMHRQVSNTDCPMQWTDAEFKAWLDSV